MTDLPASPFRGFLRNPSLIDYPGRMAAVFFVSGCNFRCRFCHNADLRMTSGRRISWPRIGRACDAFESQWVHAAVITGGEPTLADDIADAVAFFRRRGWSVKLDTNGSRPDRLRRLLPYLDYVAMDVKASPDRYADLTGWADLHPLDESIRLLIEEARDYEFRTTVVGGFHDEAQMRDIGVWIQGARRMCLQPFVPREGLPDAAFERLPRTSPACLERLAETLRPFVGNVTIRGA